MKSLILGPTSPAWAVISQGANSLSNILLAIVVARMVSPAEFGSWSVAYAAFSVSYAVLRALCSTPILIARDDDDHHSLKDGTPALGILAGLALALCMTPALLVPGLWQPLWPFLVVIPFLGTIDSIRSLAYRSRKNHIAGLVDCLWLVLQLLLFIVVSFANTSAIESYTLVWGASGLAAMSLGWLLLGVRPNMLATIKAWNQLRDQAAPLTLDQLLISARTQATPVILALVAGYAATGALRAGLTLMGLINALIIGLTPLATIWAVRQRTLGVSMLTLLSQWSLAVALIALINGALLLALPDAWGTTLLGDNWTGAESVLLPLVLHSLLRGPISGASIILKAERRMRDMLRLRARIEPVALIVPTAGALIAGATGAAWGYAVGALASAAQSWYALSSYKSNPDNSTRDQPSE